MKIAQASVNTSSRAIISSDDEASVDQKVTLDEKTEDSRMEPISDDEIEDEDESSSGAATAEPMDTAEPSRAASEDEEDDIKTEIRSPLDEDGFKATEKEKTTETAAPLFDKNDNAVVKTSPQRPPVKRKRGRPRIIETTTGQENAEAASAQGKFCIFE